jgi:hypothetical protein
VLHALLMLALGSTQDTVKDTVTHNHPNRAAYQEAVDACAEAEKLLVASPGAALVKLAPVFADIEKKNITMVELSLFIYAKAQEPSKYEFYPYRLRGRAQLLAARKQKDEEARQLLVGAVTDLQVSVAHKADRLSLEPLAEARKELWENVKAALTYEAWKPGRLGLADALALVAASERAKEASDWIATEITSVETDLRGLRKNVANLEDRKPPAARAAGWCQALAAMVRTLPAFQPVLGAAGKVEAQAVSIRDSRGTFKLKIGVSPWAKVDRLERPGEVIELVDRDTPLLVPQDLEIDTYTVELSHPTKGRKNFLIRANSLLPGRTYVLWGSMNGDLEVSELLK